MSTQGVWHKAFRLLPPEPPGVGTPQDSGQQGVPLARGTQNIPEVTHTPDGKQVSRTQRGHAANQLQMTGIPVHCPQVSAPANGRSGLPICLGFEGTGFPSHFLGRVSLGLSQRAGKGQTKGRMPLAAPMEGGGSGGTGLLRELLPQPR